MCMPNSKSGYLRPNMQQIRSIIVDDEPNARMALRGVLEENFSQVEIVCDCKNVPDAVKAINKYKPDLIFLDLNMPRMHGLDCLKHIREVRRLDGCPVVVYSTSSNPQDIVKCRAAGANDYIVKGNEVSVIKQELSQALKKYNPRLSTHEQRE